ncbi:hypothetical protein EXIGLDRAFT_839605 [Exidia glandulosa HHB12029]|uniref:Protein kinase domain-containing protein n=1 Tax=Exidia glandulosa HHB12029 TaxID=1314781 RepID=A0A165EY50_EXIGL|nr:hypothetical protein EXIGLDRAFT_839605 [Exidia glandulosa HHB12029]
MDIAEGLRYLHSKGVAWNDGHFCNMLLTEDLRIVLCDFGISSCPALNIPTSVLPGDLWRSPRPEPGTPRQDVFALATAAFVLLMGRWPHLKSFEVKLDDIEMVYGRHLRGEWDRGLLAVPGCRTLGEVLLRCWRGDYVGIDSILAAVVEACELCKRRLA